jgi:hypothetical protein
VHKPTRQLTVLVRTKPQVQLGHLLITSQSCEVANLVEHHHSTLQDPCPGYLPVVILYGLHACKNLLSQEFTGTHPRKGDLGSTPSSERSRLPRSRFPTSCGHIACWRTSPFDLVDARARAKACYTLHVVGTHRSMRVFAWIVRQRQQSSSSAEVA